MSNRTYLLTGATGFIGSAFLRALAGMGHRVRALDNESRGSRDRLNDLTSEVEWIKGDVRDAASVAVAAKGVDSICHFAYINGTEFFYTKPELILEVAVKGMMNVIDACL